LGAFIDLLINFGIGVGLIVSFMFFVDRGMKKYSSREDAGE